MNNRLIAIFKEMNEENRKKNPKPKKNPQLAIAQKPVFKRASKKKQVTVDQLSKQMKKLNVDKSGKMQKQHELVRQRLKKHQKQQKLQNEINKINKQLGDLIIPTQISKENTFMKRLNELALVEAQIKSPCKKNRLLMFKVQ